MARYVLDFQLAVVGGKGAHLGDGQRIRVNGTDGYVEILP
jgi:hypothetical protein